MSTNFDKNYRVTQRVKTEDFSAWCDERGFSFDQQGNEGKAVYQRRIRNLKKIFYLEVLETNISEATSLDDVKESLQRVVEFIRTEIYD